MTTIARHVNRVTRGSFGLAAAVLALCMGFAAIGQTHDDVHPLSNPVYADTAVPKSRVSVIYAWHELPSTVTTIAGDVPLGGDATVFAVQLEVALADDLSFVAVKDGYTDIDPDSSSPLSDESGFNDIALGLKWRFVHDDALSVALRGLVEITNGSVDVFQGNGDGNFSPAILVSHNGESSHCNAVVGAILPFDSGEESMMGYASLGYAYRLSDTIIPMIELNWFSVIESGSGEADFGTDQLGQVVPAIVEFEGGDLFNLGAENADEHGDQVTVALGCRFLLSETMDLGLGWEWPLTDDANSLFKNRANVNLTVRF